MAALNKVMLIGNLGKDPETRYLPSGEAVTNASMATTEKWKDKTSGEMKEATEWHRLSFFGRVAEIAGEYLKKGSQAYIEGRLRTRKWQDKEGNDRYTTEITVDKLVMLGGGQQGDRAGSQGGDATDRGAQQDRRPPAAAKKPAGRFDDMEDDIPF